MKICLIGDLHLGIRSNSLEFHSYFERFFTQVFFPYLKEHNIKTIFQFGDLFDSRKSINLQTLYLSKKYAVKIDNDLFVTSFLAQVHKMELKLID